MENSFGRLFTITSFGESHGRCVGAIIDGWSGWGHYGDKKENGFLPAGLLPNLTFSV